MNSIVLFPLIQQICSAHNVYDCRLSFSCFYSKAFTYLCTGVWKYWADYRTFWPISITLVLLPIYFVYSLVSIYRTFARFIGQCPAWLAVSTSLPVQCIPQILSNHSISREKGEESLLQFYNNRAAITPTL